MYISTLLFPDLAMSGFFQEPQTFPSLGTPRSSTDRKWLGIMRENFDPQASKFTRAPYSSWASGAELWSGSLKSWPADSTSASPKGPGGICRGISWLFNGGMPRTGAPGMHSPGYLLGSTALSEPSPDE